MNRSEYRLNNVSATVGTFRKISAAMIPVFFFALSTLLAQQQTEPVVRASRVQQKQVRSKESQREQRTENNRAPQQKVAAEPNRAAQDKAVPRHRPMNRMKPAARRNAYTQSAHPFRLKERKPENPVRFVFAPKTADGAAAEAMPWDKIPSAGAVMSTFLTGEISPEILDWHVNQRKRVDYEKAVAARDNLTPRPRVRNEYGDMIRRMEFSLGERGANPDAYRPSYLSAHADTYRNAYQEPYSDAYPPLYASANDGEFFAPSNGSVLVQLLTGYKNGEIRNWKENRDTPALRTEMAPLPEISPFPQQAHAYRQPLPPRPFDRKHAQAPWQVAAGGNIHRAELITDGGNAPIRTAAAEEPRFVDDNFPADGSRTPHNPIRQVSVQMPTSASSRFVEQGEKVDKVGQIRIYTKDEDGWSPAE
ncbi:MAG: hypothetical protein ACOX6D_09550 [Thermoguttaceae bacterium]|jgi:hypothetical protein